MQVGISSDEWVNGAAAWLRAPIAQGLLISLALHLAFLFVFQPESGSDGRQTVVIDARLLPAQAQTPAVASLSDPAEQMEMAPLEQEAQPEPAPEAELKPAAELLTALTPSPAPPIPLMKETPEEPTDKAMQPEPAAAPRAAADAGLVADVVELPASSAQVSGPQSSSGLPSLPIAIDPTWYLARQVDKHPKAIGVIEPAYPEQAKRRNLEGSLKLMLKIDDMGRVLSAEVVEAVPPGVFDEAALAAFRDARFHPAIRDGRPVRYEAYMRVEFKLKD